MIQCRDLQMHFGPRPVLEKVSFHLDRGETVGLVGPNGTGKTTCLRILVGLIRRSAGQVLIGGLDPSQRAVDIRKNCSYLPGETSIYHGMRGRDFLRFAASFYPRQQPELQQRLLDAFELPLHRRLRHYSAGMKQKLALVATLTPDVDLYILDEPDRALDAPTRFFLRDVLHSLQQSNKTILLSSHHLREIEAVSQRLLFLMQGRILPEAKVDAARDKLRQQIRLRLLGKNPLPAGATLLHEHADGSLQVSVDQAPLQWLAQLPAEQVKAVEFGSVRLEELYQALAGGEASP